MTKNGGKKSKKPRYTPINPRLADGSGSHATSNVMQTSSYKFFSDGSFKVYHSTIVLKENPLSKKPKPQEASTPRPPNEPTIQDHLTSMEGMEEGDQNHLARENKLAQGDDQATPKGDAVMHQFMAELHQHNPLHQIQMWNGECFEKSPLKSLGVRIQLGHPANEECPLPRPANGDDFVIFDLDEVHSVGLDYCSCGKTANSFVAQLMERRLYPATISQPKSAATFRLLEFFELLQSKSKVSASQFYQAISRGTYNTGLKTPKVRYRSFLRMVQEWRHLKLLKSPGLAT